MCLILFIFPAIATPHPEVLLVHISVYVCFFSCEVVNVGDISIDKTGGVHVNVEMAPLAPGIVTWQANISGPSLLVRNIFRQQIFQLKEMNNLLSPALQDETKEVAVGDDSGFKHAVLKIRDRNAFHRKDAVGI